MQYIQAKLQLLHVEGVSIGDDHSRFCLAHVDFSMNAYTFILLH
jgi:hypothetical protein